MEKALVKERIAPLYVSPDAEASLADELLHGMLITMQTMPDAQYVKVTTEYGYEGFARVNDLCLDARAVKKWEVYDKNVLHGASVDVLAAPCIQAKRLTTLTRGCSVAVLKEEDSEWTVVQLADERKGYVPTAHRGWPVSAFDPTDEDSFRHRLTEAALSYLGTQYRWGGKTPEGIDCSGLCSMAYWLNGVQICRDARLAPGFPIKAIPYMQKKPGDLLYFPGHIAMTLWRDRFIHATTAASCVCINSLSPLDADYRPDLVANLLAVGSLFV